MLIEEKDTRFYIANSSLAGAGKGLFAKFNLKKGDHLEITGPKVKKGSEADKCTAYADDYKFAAKSGKFDEVIIPTGYAAIVNHASQRSQQNAEIRYLYGKMVYYFLRDIEQDEEIFGNYGGVWEKAFNWAAPSLKRMEDTQDAWKTFLGYDLYNLGLLKEELTEGI